MATAGKRVSCCSKKRRVGQRSFLSSLHHARILKSRIVLPARSNVGILVLSNVQSSESALTLVRLQSNAERTAMADALYPRGPTPGSAVSPSVTLKVERIAMRSWIAFTLALIQVCDNWPAMFRNSVGGQLLFMKLYAFFTSSTRTRNSFSKKNVYICESSRTRMLHPCLTRLRCQLLGGM